MIKIVYFDEESATDYITIKNGGSLVMSSEQATAKQHTEVLQAGVRIKSLFNYLFIKGDANADLNIDLSNAGESLIKTTISNTILSDFLDLILSENNNDKIIELSGYKVNLIHNTVAYFQTITPFLRMAEGDLVVDENFKFKVEAMHDTLKSSKGYYELLATNKLDKSSKIILRFNNNAFKNNYSISDLEQMDFVYYGVKVGSMKEEALDFSNLFNSHKKYTDENLEIATSIEELEDIEANKENSDELDVYDILLAGVK